MDEDKKNKKKKIAVIIILVAIIAELIYDTDYSTVDVLDIGQSFMRIISGLFILIELFIFKEKFFSSEDSFYVTYKRIISNILLIFLILVISMGIGLRYMEEKEAIEYHEKNGNVVIAKKEDDTKYYYYSNEKAITKYEQQKRLISIYSEIDKESNEYYRYFWAFTTGLNLVGIEKAYYLIYSMFALITIGQLMFFKKYFTKLENL